MIIKCRRCKQPVLYGNGTSDDGDIAYYWCDNCVDYVGTYNDFSGVEQSGSLVPS